MGQKYTSLWGINNGNSHIPYVRHYKPAVCISFTPFLKTISISTRRQKSYVIFKGGSSQMLTFDDKGGRGVRKYPKHADVIYEWSH